MITVSLAMADKALREEVGACFANGQVQIDFEQPQVDDLVAFIEKLRHSRPDLILIDVSTSRTPVAAAMRQIHEAAPDSFLVAINTAEPSAAAVLECLRGGANEYLFPPLAEGLGRVVEGRLEEKARFESIAGGRTLCFFSAKGGCGATTLACHTAAELGRLNFKTLLADFDMDAGTVGFLMNSASPYSIADALRNTNRLDASFWGALVSNGYPGLEIVSAPASITERRRPQPEQVKQILDFARTRYQWTVADLGRGLTEEALAGLKSGSEICLISTLDIPALHHCKLAVQSILDAGIPAERMHLVLNRVPRRYDLPPAELQKMIGFPIYAAISDAPDALQEACVRNQLLSAATDPGRQMAKLARKLAGVDEPKPAARFGFFRKGA